MLNKTLSPKMLSVGFLIPIGLIVGIIILWSSQISFGLLILVPLVLFVARTPFVLIWLLFFAYMLQPYGEHYSGVQLPFGTVFSLVFGALYVVYFLRRPSDDNFRPKIAVVDMLNMAIIIIGLFMFVLSEDKAFGALGFRENTKMCFLFLFIRAIKPTEKELTRFFKIFLLVAIIVSLYGIYQYFFDYYSLINAVGGVSELTEGYFGIASGLPGHLGAQRAYSFFLNSFTLAYYLMISLILILAKISSRSICKIDKIFLLSMPALLFAFVLTFARSAWMGFLFGFVVLLLISRRLVFFKRLAGIVLVLVLLSGVIIPLMGSHLQTLIVERFTSIFTADPYQTSGHYESLGKDVDLVIKHPWGIGLGKGTPYKGEVWNESSIFKLSTEMGVIPAFLYVLVYVLTFVKGLSLYRKASGAKREFLLITVALTVAYFVSGIVFPVWIVWFPTMTLWILMGVVSNYGEQYQICRTSLRPGKQSSRRIRNGLSPREILTKKCTTLPHGNPQGTFDFPA